MNRACVIYLRANKWFWFKLSATDLEAVDLVELSSEREPEEGIHEYSYESLLAFGIQSNVKSPHIVFFDGKSIVATPMQWWVRDRTDKGALLRSVASGVAAEYRGRTKSTLLTTLSQLPDANSIDAILTAFCRYTAYDSYAAWAYNPITHVFTRIAGSIACAKDFVDEHESPLLHNALHEPTTICGNLTRLGRTPDEVAGSAPPPAPSGDIYVNAFCVSPLSTHGMLDELGVTAIQVIVCMYTNHHGYDLREDTIRLLKTFLQRDLANRYFGRILRMSKVSVDTSDAFDLDKPKESLQALAKRICTILQWETCAILLADEANPNSLILQAISPLNKESRKLRGRSYFLPPRSMTAQVYVSGKPLWSYDIANDVRNSHTIDDPTASPPRNWIGVPITTHRGDRLGVIRVKNRKPTTGTTDRNFSSLDLVTMEIVAAQIAHFLEQRQAYAERRTLAMKREREVQELSDFLRTFRHEIRSPIQAICFAPERLVRILVNENLIQPNTVPKRLLEYLSDFKATGNRLEMISKTLTLEPDELVRDIQSHNLFKECIAPVLAFATPLATKKRRFVHVVKDSLMVNMNCDCLAMSIAFHVLLDNAIKYSDSSSTIYVYGQNAPGGHAVIVENVTGIFNMTEEETHEIFKKYQRGRMPVQQKMEGSGIGLFLAKRIMELHGGELRLLSRVSPIRFALFLKN